MLEHADPLLMVHPARDALSSERVEEILDCIAKDSTDNISADEMEAVLDLMYDLVASKLQTHHGVTTIQ